MDHLIPLAYVLEHYIAHLHPGLPLAWLMANTLSGACVWVHHAGSSELPFMVKFTEMVRRGPSGLLCTCPGGRPPSDHQCCTICMPTTADWGIPESPLDCLRHCILHIHVPVQPLLPLNRGTELTVILSSSRPSNLCAQAVSLFVSGLTSI